MAVLIQTDVNALPRSCPGGTSSLVRFRNCHHSVEAHFLLQARLYIWNDVLVPSIRLHQFSQPVGRGCLGIFGPCVNSGVYGLSITMAEERLLMSENYFENECQPQGVVLRDVQALSMYFCCGDQSLNLYCLPILARRAENTYPIPLQQCLAWRLCRVSKRGNDKISRSAQAREHSTTDGR